MSLSLKTSDFEVQAGDVTIEACTGGISITGEESFIYCTSRADAEDFIAKLRQAVDFAFPADVTVCAVQGNVVEINEGSPRAGSRGRITGERRSGGASRDYFVSFNGEKPSATSFDGWYKKSEFTIVAG